MITVKTPDTDTEQVALTMGFALLFGILAVFVSLWDNGTIWRGLLWAGAWSSVGWFLGFLFGIPRYLSTDTARTPGAPVLEAAKQELAKAIETAKSLRAGSDAAALAKGNADKSASDQLQKASQAATDAGDARAKSDADPLNAALKDDADAKATASDQAKKDSDEAATAAAEATKMAQAAQTSADEADTAVETAKRKVADASTTATASPGSSLTVNTNLEQISDWLTKIIVGVSLVESQTLLEKMQNAATFMAKSMAKVDEAAAFATYGPQPASTIASAAVSAASSAAQSSSAVLSSASSISGAAARSLGSFGAMESLAYALMLYFFATGLLGSYLLTRLFLQRALANAASQSTTSTSATP